MKSKISIGWLIALCCLAVAPRAAHAQTLHGTVHDAESGAAIPGVLVTVRNPDRKVVARVLTDSIGRFYAIAGAGGRITAIAEHIGFAARQFDVELPRATALAIRLTPAPIALQSIVAETKRRCGKTSEKETARVWYLARTALGSTTAQEHRFRVRFFSRDFDLSANPVSDERMDFTILAGRHAFRAAATDSLLLHGFVQKTRDGVFFYGPDAELLLSDQFVDEHCFQLTRQAARPGMIGLSFWPNREREHQDIRGTLWVDETSGVLQFVEYFFTGMPNEVREKYAGGRVEFDRLTDGSWLVRRWSIRTPRYGHVPTGGVLRPVLVGTYDGGGEVLGLVTHDSTRSGRIAGTVYDSIRQQPLPRAHVYLSGTSIATSTDSTGAFALADVPAGEYYIDFHHAALDSIPAAVHSQRIAVDPDAPLQVALAMPSEQAVIDRHCTAAKLAESAKELNYRAQRLGVVTGMLRTSDTRLTGVRVDVRWDTRNLARLAINRVIASYWAETDSAGRFTVCGVPMDLDLRIVVKDSDRVIVNDVIRPNDRRAIHREYVVQ